MTPLAADAAQRPLILCVDDVQDDLDFLANRLRDDYRVVIARDADRALAIARAEPPDLVLMAIALPGIDGYEACRRIKADDTTREVPVILVASSVSIADEHRSLDAGASDFMVKPINPAILLTRVRAYTGAARMTQFLRSQNELLESVVHQRTRTIADVRRALAIGLAAAAEGVGDAGVALERIQRLVRIIALRLRAARPLDPALQPDAIDRLVDAVAFHDIGMGRVPSAVLGKQGALDDADRALVKQHPQASAEGIAGVSLKLDVPDPTLALAVDLALTHHEAWDGSGYPKGLKGEAIPIGARVLSLADAYNAMRSDRPYRAAISHSEALDEIAQGSGAQFDPAVVDAFMAAESQVTAVYDVDRFTPRA